MNEHNSLRTDDKNFSIIYEYWAKCLPSVKNSVFQALSQLGAIFFFLLIVLHAAIKLTESLEETMKKQTNKQTKQKKSTVW